MLSRIVATVSLPRDCRVLGVIVLLVTLTSVGGSETDSPSQTFKASRSWLNQQLAIEERIGRLIGEMTLDEKIGQLQQANSVGGELTGSANHVEDRETFHQRIRAGQVGSILNEIESTTIDHLQRIAVEDSRLGIPLLFARDVIHGFRTVFPIPLGQAASWNPELVEEAAMIAARETRSVGIHWTFAPMVDITRDPRWGRIAESLGEDPVLASALSAAMVRGFQGRDLRAFDRVAACAKHFAGYGATEGGRDYNGAQISPSLMRNLYLPPFQATVDAGVATLMTSFNEVNGIPGSANQELLGDVLRKEWMFRGLVVSDWTSIPEMITHGYSLDEKDAARAAINAGVNIEMVSQTYRDHLTDLIAEGLVDESQINELVEEVLRLKFRLGLFDRPFIEEKKSVLLAPEHLEVARRLARQSMVLLKNEGALLPLDKSNIKKLAVIGPLADARKAQLGTWAPDGREEDSRTPLAALRESADSQVEIVYAAGLASDLDTNQKLFDEALVAAHEADVVLLIVGEGAELSGEARSRAKLDLPGAQAELVEAVAGLGKPTVMFVQAGRPLTIGREIAKANAVLYSFHAGTMAGPALVDLLWGQESPSGKLPVTFPKAVGQIPLYYNHTNTGRPPRPYEFARDSHPLARIELELGHNSNYIDVSPYPLYPFGYGLSYTRFEYGPVELSTTKIQPNGILAVRATVRNSGELPADEVVQLYIRDPVASLIRPVRELKAFRRIHLAAGETSVVEFALPADDLTFHNNQGQRILEPGKFELYVGGSSLAPLGGEFELID